MVYCLSKLGCLLVFTPFILLIYKYIYIYVSLCLMSSSLSIALSIDQMHNLVYLLRLTRLKHPFFVFCRSHLYLQIVNEMSLVFKNTYYMYYANPVCNLSWICLFWWWLQIIDFIFTKEIIGIVLIWFILEVFPNYCTLIFNLQ